MKKLSWGCKNELMMERSWDGRLFIFVQPDKDTDVWIT